MTSVQWNLDPLEVSDLDIIQISIIPEALDKYQATNDRRLLVLSHSLAIKHIPSFFLSQTPNYSSFPVSNSVVMVFDLFHTFNDDDLFNWCTIHRWKWVISTTFHDTIFDDFQRALNVVSYYDFLKYQPLYFSSYLLFRRSDSISEPFLYQKIPIRRETTLCVRTSMQGSLDFIIDCKLPPPIGSYILVPPYEHPFCVVTCSGTIISVRSVEKTMMSFDINSTVFVLITRPCVLMSKFFISEPNMTSEPEKEIANQNQENNVFFESVEFHNYTQEDIDSYLCEVFMEQEEGSKQTDSFCETTVIEYPELNVDQVLSQMVPDKKKRKNIAGCIGNGTLPSHRVPLSLTVASFLSFFRFDFGFADVKPPVHAQNLIEGSTCTYERVGIPTVVVNRCGQIANIPADTLIEQWEEQRYQPISGPKSGHFVVFCLDSIVESSVRTFFIQFCNIYNLLNFGSLSPLSNDEAFHFVLFENMPSTIEAFFQKNTLSQFQQYPILSFIVGPPIYDKQFMPHSILSYVRPESIQSANEDDMKTLAFVVYSRIRNFNPNPFGKIDVARNETASLFFGFRYQPPFLLKIQPKSMTMHIAWDEVTRMSAWIDDIGSILHVLPETDVAKIFRLISDAKQLLNGTELKFTLSVLAEGISSELYREVSETFGATEFGNLTLFAVSPAPTVQVLFKEQFDDDAVIFAPLEQFLESHNDLEFMRPFSTCYVVAHTLPAYSVSLYSRDVWKPAESVVMDYAKQMSHLSWLSVKPGSEVRTISYPPHICALLRKIATPVRRISRYEFLPSLERI